MSVNVGLTLAEAYQAMTGLETVKVGTQFLVNNSGTWSSASESILYDVIKKGGAKAVGTVNSISQGASKVVGVGYEFNTIVGQNTATAISTAPIKTDVLFRVPQQYAGNALATTKQLSNGARAALQNSGAQISETFLQPITKMEVVQSTGGTAIQTTAKGILTKIPWNAVMVGAAAAQGIALGIDIVETNPQLVTKIYNKLAGTDIDPEEIANIVENTTVWANIRDGAVFIAEDVIQAIKDIFYEEGAFFDNTGNVYELSGDTFPHLDNYPYNVGVKATVLDGGIVSSSSGPTAKIKRVMDCYYALKHDNNRKYVAAVGELESTFNITFTNEEKTIGRESGQRGHKYLVIASDQGFSCYPKSKYPNDTGNSAFMQARFAEEYTSKYGSWDNTPEPEPVMLDSYIGNRLTSVGYTPSGYPDIYAVSCQVYISFREWEFGYYSDIPILDAGKINSINDIYKTISDYFKSGIGEPIKPVAPSIVGVNKIPGATLPSKSGDIADDYPDWTNKTITTIDDIDEDGNIKEKRWYPVNIFQPTGQEEAQNGDTQDDEDKMKYIVNTVDDAMEDNIQNNPETNPKPDSYPDPNPEPGTDLERVNPNPPSIDYSDGTSPDPNTPILTTALTSGLTYIYNPTLLQTKELGRKLWTTSFIENLKKIFVNPMEAIIGFHILYATPKTGSEEEIVLGYYGTDVSSKIVTNQYVSIDCGRISVNEWFQDARDYEPYTSVSLYLPFVGIVDLKADDIINSWIDVRYNVDVLTGACIAFVEVSKHNAQGTLYQYIGNCAVQIPLSSGNYTAVITSLLSVAASTIGGAMIGGLGGAAFGGFKGAAINASRTKLHVIQSGALGSNTGAMAIRKPFLIIRRPVTKDAYAYNSQYGYPANKWVMLGNMKGYTRVKSAHIDYINCTDEEEQMIDELLKTGVQL